MDTTNTTTTAASRRVRISVLASANSNKFRNERELDSAPAFGDRVEAGLLCGHGAGRLCAYGALVIECEVCKRVTPTRVRFI